MKSITRHSFVFIVIALLIISLPQKANAAFSYASGSGTSTDPYIITTCAELQSINDYIIANNGGPGTYFKLGGNVDCDVAPYNTGAEFTPIGADNNGNSFWGDFNGAGYTISGLHINTVVDGGFRKEAGLFGGTNNAAIYDLALENVVINIVGPTGEILNVGALVSESYGTTDIHDVYATGTIHVDTTNSAIAEIGGLVGLPNGSTVINHAYSTVAVTDTNDSNTLSIGGLVGHLNDPSVVVKNSFATVLPSVTSNTPVYNGGLIGEGSSSSVTNSYSVGSPLVADGGVVDGISVGGKSLASFYQASPLNAVYTASGDAWDIIGTWGFTGLSSLPVLSTHGLFAVTQPAPQQSASGFVSGGGMAWSCTDPSATNYQGSFPGISVTSGCQYAVTNPPVIAIPAITPAAAQTPAVSPAVFTQTLSLGSKNAEVKAFQQYLNTHGFPVAAKGPGSPGHETTSFGFATKAALMKFQKAHHITAVGVVGPATRAVLNKGDK